MRRQRPLGSFPWILQARPRRSDRDGREDRREERPGATRDGLQPWRRQRADEVVPAPNHRVGTPCADSRSRPGSARVGRTAKLAASIHTTETRRRAERVSSAANAECSTVAVTTTSSPPPASARSAPPMKRATPCGASGSAAASSLTTPSRSPPPSARRPTAAAPRTHERHRPSLRAVRLDERSGRSHRDVEARVRVPPTAPVGIAVEDDHYAVPAPRPRAPSP